MKIREYYRSDSEPWNQFRNRLVPQFLRAVHAPLMCSMRLTGSGMSGGAEYLDGRNNGPGAIFVVWHDMMLFPMFVFQYHNVHVIVSNSRSGQLAAALWRLHGWPTIWGSAGKRAGISALRIGVSALRKGKSIGFTPDGPLGPRHQAQPGVVHLASHSGAPVVPLGVAVTRQWQLSTWDRHCIPKPFSHAHLHAGAPLQVPPKLEREQVEEWRMRIQNSMREAQVEAQQRLNSSH